MFEKEKTLIENPRYLRFKQPDSQEYTSVEVSQITGFTVHGKGEHEGVGILRVLHSYSYFVAREYVEAVQMYLRSRAI
jgi:hypothetical protein